MSDTPRTDAVISGGTIGQIMMRQHAEQLERELAEVYIRGLEEAEKVCEALPVDKPRCRILNLPSQAWEEAQEQCASAIRARIAQIENNAVGREVARPELASKGTDTSPVCSAIDRHIERELAARVLKEKK